jgi:hypothetical protein
VVLAVLVVAEQVAAVVALQAALEYFTFFTRRNYEPKP